jgi:general secretion pathway protein D
MPSPSGLKLRARGGRRWLSRLAVAATFCLLPVLASGAVDGAATEASDRITLNFQDADINALISTISQLTGRNFIVDPRVKGKVTLISGHPLTIDEVYDVFLSVLDVHNFASVDAEDGVTKIVPISLIKQNPTPTSFGMPRPHGDAQITQVYQLKHGSVQEFIPILRPLLPPTSHFAAHAASNTLVFTDTAANIKRVLSIVERMDQPQTEGDIHVLYLRYAKAKDLVPLLNNILTAKQKVGDAKEKAQVFSVQAEESTNSLVIHARDEDYLFIRDAVDKLDVRRAQVFIEVVIAEVSAEKAQDLGVRWEFGDNHITNGQTSGSTGFSDVSGGLQLGYLKSLVEDLSGNLVPELQVVLTALRTDADTNILSTPNLLTLDNESAEIIVGQEVPFITGQYTTSSATTTTDTTTGTAVTNPFQTIERKDVGLKLNIKPQINEGDAMRLEIEQELSSVVPTKLEGAADLITNTRSIKATVMVDDGQIIVLGGLIRDDFTDNIEAVPLLGDVPLVGALFRKKSKKAVKRNLMVFLRPKIVRSELDLAGHTKEKYEQMQALQRDSLPKSKYLLYSDKPPVLPSIDGSDKAPATPPPAPAGGTDEDEEI